MVETSNEHKEKIMKSIVIGTMSLLAFVTFQLATVDASQSPKSTTTTNFTIVRIQPSAEQLRIVLKSEAIKAQKLERKPFVYFYADWCGPCRALRNGLGDKLMIDAFDGTYIIQLDADAWKDKLPGSGFSISVIPVLFEINDKGEPTGHRIDGNAWGANIPVNMAPPLKTFFRGHLRK